MNNFAMILLVIAAVSLIQQLLLCEARDTNDGSFNSKNVTDGPSNATCASGPPREVMECGIWLAPSTIKGAGLGLFAGKNFEEGEELIVGDVVIPIVDLEANQFGRPYSFLWDDYTWSGVSLGMGHEGVTLVAVASPGFHSAANSLLPIINLDHGKVSYGSTGLHRNRDPGAGAFSYYYNRTPHAMRDIQPGEEFFIDYGSKWFKSRKSSLGPIPLYDDLDRAMDLYHGFRRLRESLKEVPAVADEVWEAFVQRNSFNDSRVFGSFDFEDPEELVLLAKNQSLRDIRIQQSQRSLEWLATHGSCADHITVRRSSLPQAGRGAFASRDLPRNTVVARLPLIHIPKRKILDMYRVGLVEGIKHPDPQLGIMGRQLLLNYCLGHRDSSMLLCPYGPLVNFINHNQTESNVELRWSDHHREFLNVSVEELELRDDAAKFVMEVVADRYIRQGVEIFLNYGAEWEAAWQDHVENWVSTEDSANYVSAEQLNNDQSTELRSAFELLREPYPSNVDLCCHEEFLSWSWKHALQQSGAAVEEFLEKVKSKERRWFNCEVLSYDESDQMYRAVLYKLEADSKKADRNDLIEKIPRQGFKFIDRPYTTDMFQENAFRHDIRIPDDTFPSAWKNGPRQDAEK